MNWNRWLGGGLAVFLLVVLLATNFQLPKDDVELPPLGSEVRYQIEDAVSQGFSVQLEPGEYLDISIEQHGVDVAIEVWDPQGESYMKIDSPSGEQGTERIELWSEEGGRYRIEVEPFEGSVPGAYTVRPMVRRLAEERDRRRAQAAFLFAQAEELRLEHGVGFLANSVKSYEQASALYEKLGDLRLQGKVEKQLGQILDTEGLQSAALAAYQKALVLFEEVGDPDALRAATLSRSGVLQRKLGDYDGAESSFVAALSLFRQKESLLGIAKTLNNLGRLSSARSNYHDAQNYYEEAITFFDKAGVPSQAALTLTNLGAIFLSLGETDLALDHLRRAEKIPGADPWQKANLLDQLADAYTRLGERDMAYDRFQGALEIQRQNSYRRSEAYTLNGLGSFYVRFGEYQAAGNAFREALRIFEDIDDQRGQNLSLRRIGWLYQVQGDTEQAMRSFEEALPLARVVNNRVGEASALLGMATVELHSGRLAEGWTHANAALDLIEELRLDSGRAELSMAFLATKQDYFNLAIEIAMNRAEESREGLISLAYSLSERSRARGLLDALPRATGEQSADPDLEAEESRLSDQINAVERRRMSPSLTEENKEKLAQSLRALITEFRKIREEIRRSRGEKYRAPEPLALREVQEKVLDEETLLLQYDLGPNKSFLWAISDETVDSFVLPAQDEIESAAYDAYKMLSQSRRRAGRVPTRMATERLGHLLLEPVQHLLDKPRLLIVAEGTLQYIPFGALPHPVNGEPLLVSQEVVYAPSASIVASIRSTIAERPKAENNLAVLADPVFSRDDPRVTRRAVDQKFVVPTFVRRLLRDGSFGRLKYTREEAESILALVPPVTLSAFDFEATKDLLVEGALNNYRILHFATHGLANSHHPELSGIVLSLVDEKGKPRDGILRAHEIYRLDLNADLVMLSACQTALGAQVRGEGLVGMTHAFLRAGAARVAVSLWDVDDQATAELVRRLYHGLWVQGLSPSAALREAQLSIRSEPSWSAPYFWAGFVLQGEWH